MYSIKLQRTVPQGLLFMVLILIFFMFSLNVLLLTLAPQYVTYGNQHFPYVPATVNNAKVRQTLRRSLDPVFCSPAAAAAQSDLRRGAVAELHHQAVHADRCPAVSLQVRV